MQLSSTMYPPPNVCLFPKYKSPYFNTLPVRNIFRQSEVCNCSMRREFGSPISPRVIIYKNICFVCLHLACVEPPVPCMLIHICCFVLTGQRPGNCILGNNCKICKLQEELCSLSSTAYAYGTADIMPYMPGLAQQVAGHVMFHMGLTCALCCGQQRSSCEFVQLLHVKGINGHRLR